MPMRLATLIAVSLLAAPAAGATTPAAPPMPLVAWTSSGCPPGVHDPVVVLVATNLIHKGTLGSVILKKRLYAVASITCSQRIAGALGDPALLEGRVVTHDIYPGEQLTRRDVSGVLKVAFTTPVRAGTFAQLTVRVTPLTRCTIHANSVAEPREKDLNPKTGGHITWRWKVPSQTQPGRWPILIQCGTSGSLELTIRILSQ
jgi:hypothetical protein